MARSGKCDFKELQAFQKEVEQLQASYDTFMEDVAKRLAGMLLRRAIEKTPIGKRMEKPEQMTAKVKGSSGKTRSFLTAEGERYKKYWQGYQGGELKRSWRVGRIFRSGSLISIEIINTKEYASYVEFGHRQTPGRYVPALGKQLKKSWVPGKLMMTKSIQEIRSIAPAFLQKNLEIKLREVFE